MYVTSCDELMNEVIVFFFKQKPAYEMRISDGSTDVCSSNLLAGEQASEHRWHDRRREQEERGQCERAHGNLQGQGTRRSTRRDIRHKLPGYGDPLAACRAGEDP